MIELWKELNNSKYVFTNQGRKNKPMWKITDVSKMAGVSTATVSRVLNNKDRVDPETRKKVLEVIKKLGYVPHSIGRSLSQRKTKNVGFIVSNPKNSIQSDIFFYEIMLSMSRVFNKHGISLLTEETHGEYQDEESLPLMVRESKADVYILSGIPVSNKFIVELSKKNIPLILIGRYLERSKYNAVLMDNVEGGREATNKLIEWGHRKIGIITGPIETHTFYDRLIGYQMALKENNIEVQEDLIAYGEDFRQQNGVQGVTTLLGKNKNVTAIFACDDFIALGALNKLHELGIRVPEDISLIGYTDLPIAVQTMPPLTTMKVDRVALGEMVARLALDIMAGKIVKPVHIKMFAEVIVRESVKNLNNQ